MNRYALIINGSVELITKAESLPTTDFGGVWVLCPDSVGPGDLYDGAFSKPTPVPVGRHITQLAFLSRFTDAEAVGIDLASIGATVQAASIRRYLNKVNVAKFIDLDRADTRTGVQALEAVGLLASGRALEILDNPVQASEKF